MEHRKGARKVSDIPTEVVELLHKGQLQTVNLTEWLAVDHLVLLEKVMDELGFGQESNPILQRLSDLSEKRIMKLIPAIARELQQVLESKSEREQSSLFTALAQHLSDSVRCWAAYMIGLNQSLSLSQKLTAIRPFAADDHFGVREISWMALRESVITELHESIKLLERWVHDQDPNIRRYAIELTRPHGVWAKHITALKEDPVIALPLLEPLKSDSVKYVQDSVSNWLNDASKSNPDWVLQLSENWLMSSDTKATKRIVTRATRSITNQ
ncbi:DNA alkylation repair protein [Paenibacillus sp. FSL R5-0345]|uniref:DNA alkylation repair protein n=1 Tax=Paenibacillus sp. FSL R5-0345 TaxID=1536770 RepID=UPI0004F7D9A1|nr:DNA alkylation repair protein [Paenibacillus sp. FSL R5-0345]AIQ36304.1 DNA alkylation repair protein [Paenibacillus sp. FSL R5-0345]